MIKNKSFNLLFLTIIFFSNSQDSKVDSNDQQVVNASKLEPKSKNNSKDKKNIKKESVKKQPPKKVEEKKEEPKKELLLLDKIDAIVATGESHDVIAYSDIAKRGFDGQRYTLENIVDEYLLNGFADKLKMNVEDDDITRYLEKMKLSQDQVKEIAKQNGYVNLREFYDQFKKIYKAQQALSFKVSTELVFSEDVIEKYHFDNPKYEEARYFISIVSVPDENLDKKSVENKLKNKTLNPEFPEPYEFKESEISEQNSFIFDLKEGDVFVKPGYQGSYDLFKLVKFIPSKEYSLSERREEIVNLLKAERYQDTVKNIFEDLHHKALIIKPSFETYPAPIYAEDISA